MFKFLRFAKHHFFSSFLLFISIVALATISHASAADTTSIHNLPPIKVDAFDTDNDAGGSITVNWEDPGYEKLDGFKAYEIRRRNANSTKDDSLTTVPFGTHTYADRELSNDSLYSYTVAALINNDRIVSPPSQPAQPQRQWFDKRLWSLLVIGILFCGAVIYFIETAKRGKKFFLRRIAGLEAIDEAVGRATEMGRPILFIAGIQDMDDVQTIAGLTILGRIARTVAEYDTKINMPVRASLVMTAGR